VLDQLLAGSDESGLTYERAVSLLGYTDESLLDDVAEAFASGDGAAVFRAVNRVIEGGHDPRRFATDLLERFRDLIVLQSVPDAVARGVVDGPQDVLERMREQASRIGTATLTRYAEVVHAGLGEMRGATAPRLLLEVVCARMLLPSASDTESALLQRIERIETRLDISTPAAPATAAPQAAASQTTPRPQTTRKSAAPRDAPRDPPRGATAARRAAPPPQATEPAPPPPEPAETRSAPGTLDAAAVRSMWPTVREKVRKRSRTIDVMLAGATVRAVEGDHLVLSHDSAPLAKRLGEQRNADVIREALKDALGVDWRIRCDADSTPPAPAAAAPAEPIDDHARRAEQQAREAQHAEEESMLAEAGRDQSDESPRRDPEEVALELLQNELGARRIENG
jgi:DNA polymerase-3 subunit gamma/tau